MSDILSGERPFKWLHECEKESNQVLFETIQQRRIESGNLCLLDSGRM